MYPTGDFSRFAHSIGVCHVAGRVLEALIASKQLDVDDRKLQLFRLAALLHDIGHYPFSHAFEEAVDNFYKKTLFGDGEVKKSFNHERAGKEILSVDPQLTEILGEEGYSPTEVAAIFMHESADPLANLISSELDADRIDYLLRMSHSTGLPYGSVDIDYLVSELCLDNEKRLCVSNKGLRTAEHLLLSRYFANQQIAFHKTVVAVEQVLADVVGALLEAELLDCSAEWVSQSIQSGDWHGFTDDYVLSLLPELQRRTTDEVLLSKIRALLERRLPKLIVERSFIHSEGSQNDKQRLARERKELEGVASRLATESGLDPRFWFVRSMQGSPVSAFGANISIAALRELEDSGALSQGIRVRKRDGSSEALVSSEESILSIVGGSSLCSAKLYFLAPPAWNSQKYADEVKAMRASAGS
ncbi:MAG: HD domain-containing protein [Thermoanaerobaculia bacterium]